ncbi:DMT family transporter [Actinoplanes sp. NPDC049265]|uniref:DMT family transporter n=1 Tax=Actinoplanes sp. NPDC049265 TaxID=3363902 RepID=UPI003718CB34
MLTTSRWRGAGLVLAAMMLSGTVGPAQVLIADSVTPTAIAGWRHLISGLVMCLLAVTRNRHAYRFVRGRRNWSLLVAGGLLSAGHQVSFLKAVSLTGAALGTVVAVATVPLFTGIAARRLDREKLGRSWLAGSVIATAGCAALLLPGAGPRVDVAGIGFGVLAGLIFAAYTVVSKRLATAVPDVTVSTGVTMLIGATALIPAILTDTANLGDARTVTVLAWLGVLATATYSLYFAGLKHITANLAGTLNLAEPLAAVLISTAVLGERLSGTDWLAGATVLSGVLIATITFTARSPAISTSGLAAMGIVAMPIGVPVRPELIGVRPRAIGRARPPGLHSDETRALPTQPRRTLDHDRHPAAGPGVHVDAAAVPLEA